MQYNPSFTRSDGVVDFPFARSDFLLRHIQFNESSIDLEAAMTRFQPGGVNVRVLGQFFRRCAALTGLVLWLASPAAAVYPAAGVDAFDSMAAFRVSSTQLGIPETSVVLVGPTTIRRGAPYDPGDGLVEIDTQIENMVLFGSTPIGNVVVRVIPPSPGKIKQQEPGVDFPANSWFDVRVEVQIISPSGQFRLFSDPNTPVRLMAMIDAIPPFGSQYMPDGTFPGVDLVDESGQVVGFLSHIGHFVGQHPTFSAAPDGPSSYDPADLLGRPTAPRIRASDLGLAAGDDVDGVSYGLDLIFPPLMDVRFTVDENSLGRIGSAVRDEAEKSPNEAHGDEFRVIPFAQLGGGSNVQVLDETGDTAPPFPLQISDDVDSLAEQPPDFADGDGDGIPEREIYFTLSAASPSLGALGVSAADILVTSGGGPPTVFISHSELGLTPDDDIDAFCLSSVGEDILYSLAPGSVSLAGQSAADTFLAVNLPESSPQPFYLAAHLGLDPEDNVNALKCHSGEIDEFFESRLEFILVENGQTHQVSLPCETSSQTATKEGYTGMGEFRRVPFFLGNLDCSGEYDGGPISAGLRPINMFPFQFNQFFIFDDTDDGRLNVPPFGDGVARMEGEMYLNFNIAGMTGLHHPSGIPVAGTITRKPPRPGEFLEPPTTSALTGNGGVAQAVVTDLFLEGGAPTPFAITAVRFTPDARVKPEVAEGGFVDAAAGGEPPSPGGLASLYGTFETELAIAETIPLPRVLGDTVQVRFLVDDAAQAAASTGRKNQAAQLELPAPLLFVSSTQINLQIPWEVDADAGTVTAIVSVNGVDGDPVELPIAPVSPGMFTADFGPGRAIAINPDGSLAQPLGSLGNSRPAVPGETLQFLVTGLGVTSPVGVSGANSFDMEGNFVRRDTVQQPTVLIGGVEAPLVFSGLSPEFVGVFQINATVPDGVAPGDQVPLVIEIGGLSSRDDVTMAVGAAGN